MSSEAAGPGAAPRMPVEPYPGLRPFLDFEAALLFGRERQVREVIERLRQTQFVAVIGGSGSGKSSLVLAGAVPELRSFGIPGAGDFWIPMVCTPGTNVAQSDGKQGPNTPIMRLAWKFATLLRSRGSPEKDAARLDEIANRLREEVGFANLVDLYTDELATPPGPDPKEVRLLFVIDQFEELFHPTNKGVKDCALLVERIIDHFFSPHPRCYVVLTMRSEHLNDCAGYLELPDAINKSSYLVRRLDQQELRNAIVEPAKRLLRLQQRSENAGARLPDAVTFDDDVVDRLLDDVKDITADADHLPLLQHVLARIWQAAVARVKDRLDLPDRIVAADLVQAASAAAADAETTIDPRINVLRASLEKWAEAAYQRRGGAVPRPPDELAQLDALLRRLAFKDPNTGMYTQQRLNVDDCTRLLGADGSRAGLRALLDGNFLGNVDYLFWDDENPQRVTLKVSHESFIRGWRRFRQAIDAEADRFEEFADLLRKCERWQRQGQTEPLLLQEGELRRLRDADLEAVLREPVERAAWFRFLLLDRDGARLARLEPDIDRFVAASVALERAALDGVRRRRRNKQRLAAAALLAVPPVLFWVVVQGPVLERTSLLFSAGSLANATPLRSDQSGVGAAAPSLQALLEAAALVDRGRAGRDSVMAGINHRVLETFSGLPFVRPHAEFVAQVAAVAEPAINGNLRALMQSAVWRGLPQTDPESDMRMAVPNPDAQCSRPGADDGATLPGRLFTARHSSNPKLTRSMFVPDLAPSDTMVEVRAATVDAATGACETLQEILKIPRHLDPDLLIDSNLRHVAYTTAAVAGQPKTVALYEIDWERSDDERSRLVRKLPRAVLTGNAAPSGSEPGGGSGLGDGARVERTARLASAGRMPPVALVKTWRSPLGRTMLVDGQPWRIFGRTAMRISEGPSDDRLEPLQPSAPDSACGRLRSRLPVQPGFELEMHEDAPDAAHCFAVARGRAPDAKSDTQQVVVAVYVRPLASALADRRAALPAPIASLPSFTQAQPLDALTWFVGRAPGPLAGWVAMGGPDSDGKPRHVATPWSTCALWRIGKELLAQQPAVPGLAETAEPDEGTCQDR